MHFFTSTEHAAEDAAACPERRWFLETLAAASVGALVGWPDLTEAKSTGSQLEGQVSRLVKRMRRQGLILASESTSWSVYDFTTRTKLVSINEAVPRQAASMIKPFVAQAYFYQVSQGKKGARYTNSVRHTMERMIQHSDNRATNRLFDLVSRHGAGRGPREVEAVLKANAPGIFKQVQVVEKIPASGATYANRASAWDYSRFLYALHHGKLPYSKEMHRLMRLPNHDRITTRVASMPSSVHACDKTGSTAKLCGDMGIIEARDRYGHTHAYTMIGIIERQTRARHYGSWISKRSDAIREVSNLVYLYMKDRHRLV
ncbi:hypothetical protein ThidrDRAFT_0350 [Thiorhodococcus drewsii AZ1]|uniref:beta-lactamase n=1 Tax=Thiorhodococcus drewsii AZ1 TaxID=765913 RepID=G2DWG1_9GAMM|nr:serine hydrolase [Thiorhodococcus drewsii]EGV33661.1 hypothetical protein ThidrDRAFT_0350 [Thiorhodococcus drewsii AZ1]